MSEDLVRIVISNGYNLFRSRYNNNRNEIVFLALSDDYNWIKVGDSK